MTTLYLVLGAVALALMAIAASYNRFVHQRQLIKDSWSNIDTELRRRYDLIPNLVETVKGYAAHEKEIVEAVSRARASALAAIGPPPEQAAAENVFVQALRGVLAISERYPELKASKNFLSLQKELANTEDRIQAARRFYNGNVREFNRRVQAFPSSLMAGMMKLSPAQYFEIDDAARTGPAAAF